MDLDNGPYVVTPYLVMRALPEGEKLLSYGAFYSIDSSKEPYVSLNIMDYEQVYYLGITPQQVDRIHYTLEHAYLIPGGKPAPVISKGAKSESNIMIAY